MKFPNPFNRFALILLGLIVMLAFAPNANAAFEVIQHEVTITSGTAGTTQSLTLSRAIIRDVIMFVPELDSGDTANIFLSVPLGDEVYTPNGWTAKAVGATGDDALVKANSSQLGIIVDGTVNFALTASSNQSEGRTYIIYFLIET